MHHRVRPLSHHLCLRLTSSVHHHAERYYHHHHNNNRLVTSCYVDIHPVIYLCTKTRCSHALRSTCLKDRSSDYDIEILGHSTNTSFWIPTQPRPICRLHAAHPRDRYQNPSEAHHLIQARPFTAVREASNKSNNDLPFVHATVIGLVRRGLSMFITMLLNVMFQEKGELFALFVLDWVMNGAITAAFTPPKGGE